MRCANKQTRLQRKSYMIYLEVEKLVSKSKLTENDVAELSAKVDEDVGAYGKTLLGLTKRIRR